MTQVHSLLNEVTSSAVVISHETLKCIILKQRILEAIFNKLQLNPPAYYRLTEIIWNPL